VDSLRGALESIVLFIGATLMRAANPNVIRADSRATTTPPAPSDSW
jgi:hypothetical protein